MYGRPESHGRPQDPIFDIEQLYDFSLHSRYIVPKALDSVFPLISFVCVRKHLHYEIPVTQYPPVALHQILAVQSRLLCLFPSPEASDQTATDQLRLAALRNTGQA